MAFSLQDLNKAVNTSLCICLALSEDLGTEGLSSTSLVDFTSMSHMESLESSEQTNLKAPESDLVPSALQAAPGSGFASEENEDSKILQSQYFWEEGGDLNDSSLYPGATPDYNVPLASQKALPKGDVTQTKNQWEVPAVHQPSDAAEPDSETPSTSTLEEEEGLLPINQSKGAPQSSQRPKVIFPETTGQDSLYSILLSTATSRRSAVTEAALERQEEESVPEHASSGFDLGSSMGPSLLPLSSILSATPEGPQGVSEVPFKSTSESTVAIVGAGRELAEAIATAATVKADVQEVEATTRGEGPEPTAGAGLGQADSTEGRASMESTETAEMEQTNEDLLLTASHGDGFQATETVSRTPGNPSSPSSSVDWTDKPAPTPTTAWNSTKQPVTATATAEQSFVPQTEDVHMAVLSTGVPWSLPQVTCKDWSNLAGKNYIILNMSDNIECEEFRLERGPQLLALVEEAFSRYENGLQNQWWISLSKPNENDKHLLMTLAGEHGVIPTNDVLLALDDMRRNLAEIGIQNYTTTTSCQSRPSQTHSDYGKLFVVLVIIGSVCVIIIIMGLIYNCWQRRLPKMKNMSHGEELRFVENGCHDNPTLDVASDSQSEMQEKKPSVNGGASINGPESWDVLINKRAGEEGDAFEEDTHL
ncbi:PREDICTED: podocalyxin-like protein 2 [Gekko japonicus]|uniref:Podocalyxin-like protein 2 n=1 Tax=Gekko japonicus TaxID=146911 RepID=A0ABM1L6H9_GEKJA|nr:PREDICTED: podocalyxin-like protein 2 [Gekko japonicus]